MLCPNCKTQNIPEAKFCASCGAILNTQIPSQTEIRPKDIKRELAIGIGAALLVIFAYFFVFKVMGSIAKTVLLGTLIGVTFGPYQQKILKAQKEGQKISKFEIFKSWQGIMIATLVLSIFMGLIVVGVIKSR